MRTVPVDRPNILPYSYEISTPHFPATVTGQGENHVTRCVSPQALHKPGQRGPRPAWTPLASHRDLSMKTAQRTKEAERDFICTLWREGKKAEKC